MEPPDAMVRELNRIGFVQVDDELASVFTRTAVGSALLLRLEPLSEAEWRVGIWWRSTAELDTLPRTPVPFSLGRLGKSHDGDTIDLTSEELITRLPRLIEDCVLPTVERAPV